MAAHVFFIRQRHSRHARPNESVIPLFLPIGIHVTIHAALGLYAQCRGYAQCRDCRLLERDTASIAESEMSEPTMVSRTCGANAPMHQMR
jgi:hypothetical protein